MFYVKENIKEKDRLEALYKKAKVLYGSVPPQMEFLGSIGAEYLESFLDSVVKLAKQKVYTQEFLALIRLHIATKEGFIYCKAFNTKMLLKIGLSKDYIKDCVNSIDNFDFEKKYKEVAKLALKVIYNSKECSAKDFDSVEALGFSQKEIFILIEHASTLFRNGRILDAYLEK